MEAQSGRRHPPGATADRLAPGRVRRVPEHTLVPVELCCNVYRLQDVWQYYDSMTLLPISRTEWARRVCVDWQGDNGGRLPTVRQLAILADVGHGTAERGIEMAAQVCR